MFKMCIYISKCTNTDGIGGDTAVAGQTVDGLHSGILLQCFDDGVLTTAATDHHYFHRCLLPCCLVVEQTHTGEAHDHAVLVGSLDDVVIADGAAGLGNVLHAGLAGALHVVAEGEEGIGTHRNAGLGGQPGLLFLTGQRLGLLGEVQLPGALSQNILILVGDVDVDGVVTVGALDALHKGQCQHLGALTEVPVVRLAAPEA